MGKDGGPGFATREAEDLREVETRLLRVFGATVGEDEVRHCVESAYAHFDRVPVRTYVLLLTERRAAGELRAVEQASVRSA
jgi:hypothetical protein